MKKLLISVAAAALMVPGAASAHPTDVAFDSFGECQAELNHQNKVDRERVSWFFESMGAAQVSMLDNFRCDYDPDTDAWYFSDLRSEGGGNLGNGNAQAPNR